MTEERMGNHPLFLRTGSNQMELGIHSASGQTFVTVIAVRGRNKFRAPMALPNREIFWHSACSLGDGSVGSRGIEWPHADTPKCSANLDRPPLPPNEEVRCGL